MKRKTNHKPLQFLTMARSAQNTTDELEHVLVMFVLWHACMSLLSLGMLVFVSPKPCVESEPHLLVSDTFTLPLPQHCLRDVDPCFDCCLFRARSKKNVCITVFLLSNRTLMSHNFKCHWSTLHENIYVQNCSNLHFAVRKVDALLGLALNMTAFFPVTDITTKVFQSETVGHGHGTSRNDYTRTLTNLKTLLLTTQSSMTKNIPSIKKKCFHSNCFNACLLHECHCGHLWHANSCLVEFSWEATP